MESKLAPGANPNLREFKYQTVQISVSAAAPSGGKADYSESFETDKQYKRVVGVAFEIIPSATGVNTDNLKIGKFEIQNREVYVQDFPVKLMLCSSDTEPNKKFDRAVNEVAEGSKVSVTLSEYNSGTFVPYKVVVILMLSNRAVDMPDYKEPVAPQAPAAIPAR